MKNVNLTIPYDEEKLTALKIYADQKEISIEAELVQALENLYTQLVPKHVREFLAMKQQKKAKKAKPEKPVPSSEIEGDGS